MKNLIVQLIVLEQIWLPLDCFATNVLKGGEGGERTDILLHEKTYMYVLQDQAPQKYFSTTPAVYSPGGIPLGGRSGTLYVRGGTGGTFRGFG